MLKSPVGFRRVLFGVAMTCGVFVFYLLWHQSVSISDVVPSTFFQPDDVIEPKKNFENQEAKLAGPVWTWTCINKRCERQEKPPDVPIASLTTCNMLCGSTQLWPQPTGPIQLSTKSVTFAPSQLELAPLKDNRIRPLIENAFKSFFSEILSTAQKIERSQGVTDLKKFTVRVNVKTDVAKLRLKTDESYSLLVKTEDDQLAAVVEAQTFFGARHGLVTLAQLVWWDENAESLMIVKSASVKDRPVFAYRGILLDTSRNFLPIASIKRALIGMAANKLNVFHWHISDSQSFPFESPSVPLLAQYGAYGPHMTYNPEQIRNLVEFANVRGIRVVIEIDAPAHAGNGWTWGVREGLGELAVCINEQPWSLYCGEPPCGQLNPQNPNTYDVLEKLYSDVLRLTGEDEIFHLGGDEVNLECWSQHLNWTGPYANYTDLHDVWGDFTVKALQRLQRANDGRLPTHIIIWSSNLTKRPYAGRYLNKALIVQAWGPSMWPETPDILEDGYRVIISHVDAWYLDCGYGRWRENGEGACDPYRPWQTVYNHRPWQSYKFKRNVLGGEACLWTEQVDGELLDGRLWPRAAAFAERLWTDPKKDISIEEDVYTRLVRQRERLVRLGIKAEAMWPLYCTQNPGLCL